MTALPPPDATCYCAENVSGHAAGDHEDDRVGFYFGNDAWTCTMCRTHQAENPTWYAPIGMHVHAYALEPDWEVNTKNLPE